MNNSTVAATKIRTSKYAMLQMWCDQNDQIVNDMLARLIDVFLRYIDKDNNLTDEMMQIISMFESQPNWTECFNMTDCRNKPEVKEAIYLVGDEEGKKPGVSAVWVKQPFFGNWTENSNSTEILERVMSCLFHSFYRKLRLLGAELDTKSIFETVEELMKEHYIHALDTDIADLFADNNRGENGRKPNDNGPYKRKQKRTKEIEQSKLGEKMEGKIEFNPEDDGWRPMGVEW